MKNETKDAIIQKLESFMVQHNVSANEVAAKTGINSSYISIMRSGAYMVKVGEKEVEIQSKYYEQLAGLCGYSLQKEYWEPRRTDQTVRMLATLEDAKRYGYTNVVIGETGCGKTYTANVFMQNHPIDFFIVTVGSQDFIGDVLEKIIKAIGSRQATGKSKSSRISQIVSHLKGLKLRGQRPLIYFDESEYMKHSVLCSMKELYDNLNGICGIVLGGTDQLTQNLDKLRKRNKPGIPQFYRRIKFGIRQLPGIDRDFKVFLSSYEKPLQRFLRENCENYGELHDVLVPALREADRTGQPMTEDFVKLVLGIR